jgi:hypothetical protein
MRRRRRVPLLPILFFLYSCYTDAEVDDKLNELIEAQRVDQETHREMQDSIAVMLQMERGAEDELRRRHDLPDSSSSE